MWPFNLPEIPEAPPPTWTQTTTAPALAVTLRDLYAGMAMQGLLADGCADEPHELAAAAYDYADALCAERMIREMQDQVDQKEE